MKDHLHFSFCRDGVVRVLLREVAKHCGLAHDEAEDLLAGAVAAGGGRAEVYTKDDEYFLDAAQLRLLASHAGNVGHPAAESLGRLADDLKAQQSTRWPEFFKKVLEESKGIREARDARHGVIYEHLYFFQDVADERIKIGCSNNVASRMRGIAQNSGQELRLLGTMPGGEVKEKELHTRFAHLRLRGEWFSPGDDLLDYIRENAKTP